MQKIYEVFGSLMSLFFKNTNSIFFTVLLFGLFIRALFAITFNKYYKSIQIGKALEPEIQKIKTKHPKDVARQNKETSELMIRYGYTTFGFIIAYIAQLFLGVCASLTTVHSAVYINGATNAPAPFFFIPDITVFTFAGIKSLWPSTELLIYLMLPAIACVMQYYHDKYMREKSLMERTVIDYITLGITVIACIALPQTFSVFWIANMTVNFLMILVYTKFIKVKIRVMDIPDRAQKSNKRK